MDQTQASRKTEKKAETQPGGKAASQEWAEWAALIYSLGHQTNKQKH